MRLFQTRHPVTLLMLGLCLLLIQCESVANPSDRAQWQPPEKIMDAIGVEPGMVIAEAGSGEGFFTFYLARRVGPDGRVYANDIDDDALRTLAERATREGLDNVEIVRGGIEDPRFPERRYDLVMMVYVLHHLDRPVAFMENMKKYLAPGVPLVIIERNTTHERAHPPSFMTRQQVLETMERSGYVLVRELTFLARDTIYVYELETP